MEPPGTGHVRRLIVYVAGILASSATILGSLIVMLVLTGLVPALTAHRGLSQVVLAALGLCIVSCVMSWQGWCKVSQLILGLVLVEVACFAVLPKFSGLPVWHSFNIEWMLWLSGMLGLPWLSGITGGQMLRRLQPRRGPPA
jgi:hypothetical protein